MTLCLCVIVGRHRRGVVLTRIWSLAFPYMRYLDLLRFRSHLPFANSPPFSDTYALWCYPNPSILLADPLAALP